MVHQFEFQSRKVMLREHDGVPLPSPFSIMLAENLYAPAESAFDAGCGCGVQSIVLALLGTQRVVAVDVSAPCIRATDENAELNGCASRITAIEGDLFSSVGEERFQSIVSNAPTLPATGATPEYCRASEDGRGFLDALIARAPDHLSPGGMLQLVHSSLANLPRSLRMLEEEGFRVRVQASRWIPFRPFYHPHLPLFRELQLRRCAEFQERDGVYLEEVSFVQATLK